jgi:hypothetical protein
LRLIYQQNWIKNLESPFIGLRPILSSFFNKIKLKTKNTHVSAFGRFGAHFPTKFNYKYNYGWFDLPIRQVWVWLKIFNSEYKSASTDFCQIVVLFEKYDSEYKQEQRNKTRTYLNIVKGVILNIFSWWFQKKFSKIFEQEMRKIFLINTFLILNFIILSKFNPF